jgi:phosphatidylglycerophosphate synthase
MVRAALVGGVLALSVHSLRAAVPTAVLVATITLALVLDAVDGAVARHTGTASPLGGRFDMEIDAFLILVLSLIVARQLGAWVVTIGAMRYVFWVAGRLVPWLGAPVPPRYWRKVVAATQGIVLTAVASKLFPAWLEITAVAVALALLVESFGRDVVWQWQAHQRSPERNPTLGGARR